MFDSEQRREAVDRLLAEHRELTARLSDPAVHQVMYQSDDVAAIERAVSGAEMQRLIADFNRDWPDVTRTRESFVLAQTVPA